MEKGFVRYFWLSLFLIIIGNFLFADITWGNQTSTLRVSSGANLNISTTSLQVQGTLEKKVGATLSGNSVIFNAGIFASEGTENNFTGTFDIGSSGIVLQTGDLLRCRPGSIIEAITITGSNNRIEGQPVFSSPISLMSNATSFTLAIQSTLNKNILFNGGTLVLDDHLWLSDGVTFTGPGVIDLNQKQIHFSGSDISWTGSFFWVSAADINLHGNVALSGIWTFSGSNKINGNDFKLDISLGGILIKNNATLRLSNINLAGLKQGALIFEGSGSRIFIDNSTMTLDQTITFTQGGIYVDGPLTIKSTDHGLIFDQNASLTIDGALVQYFVTVFDPNNQILPALINDPNHVFITLLNNGSIITINQTNAGISQLVDNVLTGTIFLGESVEFFPRHTMIVGGDTTLNGSGSVIIFSNTSHAQVTLRDNVTLTLQDIVLTRLNNHTFKFGKNSKIKIGSNVIWELSEDLVLNQGNIILSGELDTFIIRGLGGQRKFTLPYNASIDLGTNTLIFEAIEFFGHKQVKAGRASINNQLVVGAMAMGGETIINVTNNTDANFIVEGFNNELRIAKNNISLTGNLIYSDFSAFNELHINPGTTDTLNTLMQLNFGNDFLSLSSLQGRAQLIFDKPMAVYNISPTSFVLGEHGHLGGLALRVLHNPIKQISARVSIDPFLLLTSDQPNAINSVVVRSFSRFDGFITEKPTTAFHLQRIREQETIPMPQKSKSVQPLIKPYMREPVSYPTPVYDRFAAAAAAAVFGYRSFSPYELVGDAEVRSLAENSRDRSCATRAVQTNIDYDIQYFNTVSLGSASGIILLDGSEAIDFNASLADPLNLTLKDKATITQGNSDVVINSGNVLNIVGTGNKIKVFKNFTLEGALRFTPGSSLTIEFSEQGVSPTFVFASSEQTLLEAGVVLEFKGRGTIKCSDGTVIALSKASSGFALSSFIINDGAVLTLMQDATTTFLGSGKISLINNGTINLNNACQILVGNSNLDDLDVVVQGGNILMDLGGSTTIPQANISFQKGLYSLSVNRGGLISVGSGGRLEFNALQGLSSSAFIKNISLAPAGNIRVDRGGQIIIGENKRTFVPGPGLIGTEIPFVWDSLSTRFGGKGLVGFVGQVKGKSAFMGQLQATSDEILFRTNSIKAEELVRKFVQSKPSLLVSTLFVDVNGKNVVRTITGVQVVLDENMVVTGDDIDGNIFLLNTQTGQASTLNSAGL